MFGHDVQNQSTNDNTDFSQAAADVQDNSGAPSLPTDLTTPDPAPSDIGDVATPTTPAEPTTSSVSDDELADIKQQALQQLGPLVGNLDQPPEEKFRTTMMMIQASDDHGLIKAAYDAAQAIPDEKARAQALLDVVNEINYFSQRQN